MDLFFSLISDHIPWILTVLSGAICISAVQAIVSRTVHPKGHTTSQFTAMILEMQSGLMLWTGVLSHYESLSIIMYYSRVPNNVSVLVNVWKHPIFGWWVALQGVKFCMTVLGHEGLTGAILRHVHLIPVYLYAQFHSNSLSTPLLASLVTFHLIDGVRDMVDFVYGRSAAGGRSAPRGGPWSSRLILLGLWFNWRVWFYSELARASLVDAVIFSVPLCAQLALGIKMLIYLK